jgi:hypothetical protein
MSANSTAAAAINRKCTTRSGPLCVAALVEPVSLALCVDFINDPVEHGEHTNTDVHQYYGARAINNIYKKTCDTLLLLKCRAAAATAALLKPL